MEQFFIQEIFTEHLPYIRYYPRQQGRSDEQNRSLQSLHPNGRKQKMNKCQRIKCKITVSAKRSTLLNPGGNSLPLLFLSQQSAHFATLTQLITSSLKYFLHYVHKQLPQQLFLLHPLHWLLLISPTSKHGSLPELSPPISLCQCSCFSSLTASFFFKDFVYILTSLTAFNTIYALMTRKHIRLCPKPLPQTSQCQILDI